MPRRRTQPDPAELVVLSLLRDEPLYGYALTQRAAQQSAGAVSLTPGVLYPLLKRLESQGLVFSSWEEVRSDRAEPGETGRRRKWYRLSPRGRRRLAQSIEAHRAYTRMMDAILGEPRAEGN
ncbi:MAG: helix-turn-helix transcriptional regulator [Phycisphaeraceae bacterium]|nr:helix-turn-helix transcriptional regulator [Phycisphaeraceae bacterium]